MNVKLFTRFGALIHAAHLAGLIVVPEVIEFSGRFFLRDFPQMNEFQRYSEISVHRIGVNLKNEGGVTG